MFPTGPPTGRRRSDSTKLIELRFRALLREAGTKRLELTLSS
jgi:hypothetical protein